MIHLETEIIFDDLGAGPNAAFTNLASTCTGAAPVTLVPVTSGGVFSRTRRKRQCIYSCHQCRCGWPICNHLPHSMLATNLRYGNQYCQRAKCFIVQCYKCCLFWVGIPVQLIWNVGGGLGNFTYNWSNGTHTQDLTGVAAGNYTLVWLIT